MTKLQWSGVLIAIGTLIAVGVIWMRETPDKCLSSNDFLGCEMEITK
jgi:hypothetical protein